MTVFGVNIQGKAYAWGEDISNPEEEGANTMRVKNSELRIGTAPSNKTVTVGVVAAAVYAGESGRITDGNYMCIDNTLGTSTVYYLIGGGVPTAGVAGTGRPIPVGDFREIYTSLAVICIADASNANVRIEERVIV